MTLLDDLNNVQKSNQECAVKRLLKQLPAKESEAVNKAIDDVENSPISLSRILSKNGYDISRHTISRHRKRGNKDLGCSCP